MKTCSSYVVVGTYTTRNLFQLISKINKLGIQLGPGKDIIKKMIEWPEHKFPRRSEIFPYASNFPAKCNRLANFFELCVFVLKRPGFACQMGSIEAYDDSLEELQQVTGINLTVPVFAIYNYKATLYLKPNDAPPAQFKLGAFD